MKQKITFLAFGVKCGTLWTGQAGVGVICHERRKRQKAEAVGRELQGIATSWTRLDAPGAVCRSP